MYGTRDMNESGTAGNGENDRGGALPVREQTFRMLRRDRGVIIVRHGAAG
jgi:hypothetical protein